MLSPLTMIRRSGWSLALVWSLLASATGAITGCDGAVPKPYVRQAEPGVTLSNLARQPEAYRDKVVILGGVIVEHKAVGGRVWLRLRNRPLDADFVPHEPVSLDPAESGHFWVQVAAKGLSKNYQSWARVTVVGRVLPGTAAGPWTSRSEPALTALYLRGWGAGGRLEVWEDRVDANYLVEQPVTLQEGR